jgi:hypothetical protein
MSRAFRWIRGSLLTIIAVGYDSMQCILERRLRLSEELEGKI